MAVAGVLMVGMMGMTSVAAQEGARDIDAYAQAAMARVSSMHAGPLVDWQALDGHSLVVWTAPDRAWLVGVAAPCEGLLQAEGVAFTSENGQIRVGKDSLRVGDASHCRIRSIQPVNQTELASVRHTGMDRELHAVDSSTPEADVGAYEDAAKSKVPSMHAGPVVDWWALDGQTLAVWTSPDTPWLVRVQSPCADLMQAQDLAFTSRDGQVRAGQDMLRVDDMSHCGIATIQPLDFHDTGAMAQHQTRKARTVDVGARMSPDQSE